jgi:uncharacterized protein (DUF1015 family)
MWPLTEASLVAGITHSLADETIFIADGHHRYETALSYRDRASMQRDLAPDDPVNFIMMYLCSMDDPGLLVLPTHRIVRQLPRFDPAALLTALRRDFLVREMRERSHLFANLAAKDSHVRFGVLLRDSNTCYEITLPDYRAIDHAAAELPPVVRHLDVTVLDQLIFRDILGVDADTAARAGQLRYSHDQRETCASVEGGDAQVAFVLGPPDLGLVQAVCLSGETMPQKSTYFYPKLLSGLLFHPLSNDLVGREHSA